jgi:hypothetical protein
MEFTDLAVRWLQGAGLIWIVLWFLVLAIFLILTREKKDGHDSDD